MKARIFTGVLVILVPLLSFASKKEDSLLTLLSKSRDTARVNLLCKLASIVSSASQDKGLKYGNRALDEAKKLGYIKGESKANHTLGVIYYYKGEYEKALGHYLSSRKLSEQAGDKLSTAQVDLEIGNLYKKTKRPDEALEFFRSAGRIFTELDRPTDLANLYNNIGMIAELRPDLDSATWYYNKARALYDSLDDSLGLSYSLDYLCGAFLQKKNFSEALRFGMRALAIRERLGNGQALAISYNNIGEIYAAKSDDKNAISYFEKSIALAQKIGFNDLAQYSCNEIAKCYARLNEGGKAYEYLSLGAQIKDRIYTENQSRQLAEMQTRYETEKKERENQLLAQENLIKDLELKKKQRMIYVTLAISILGLTILLFVYTNYRNRQKALLNAELLRQEQIRNKTILITQENERKRIAEELHDGIGQMMSAVKLNIAALEGKLKVKDEQYTNALALIDDSCRELRNISHNMMPGILIKAGLVPAVKELVNKINSSGHISISVEAEDSRVRLGETLEVNFFRIIQELITNIIKYANATRAQVSLSVENDVFTIMIEDNGKGFDKEILKTSPGNGWNNIASRLNLLNGKIEIDSQPGKGTVVFIEAPLVK